MLLRWIRRAPTVTACPPPNVPVPVAEIPVGTAARVDHISSTSPARLSRLASFGIVTGSEVTLVVQRPAIVIACGAATLAVEDAVGSEIWVRRER